MYAILLLGVAGLVGYVCTRDPQGGLANNTVSPKGYDKDGSRDFGTRDTSESGMQHTYMRDMHDAGISYSQFKPSMLNVTNLNEAWKPYSPPDQKETRSLFEFYQTQAKKNAYLGEYAHQFYFMRDGEIPLASAEQSNPNVELPCRFSSFRGDPNNSLTHYPRAYYDISCGGPTPHIFSEAKNRVWNAGQPTESEVVNVPREGQVNREFNPWGPGGVLQRIFNTRNERETRRKGVDRATRAVPPPSTYFNNKYR